MPDTATSPNAPTARGPAQADARPVLAVLTNVPTPYRLALHARIDREIPQVRLVTIYTHDVADQAWDLSPHDPTRELRFGQGDGVASQGSLKRLPHDWAKASRIIAHLRTQPPAALLLCGYNDVTRLRVLRYAHREGIPTFLVGDSNIHGDTATGPKAAVKHALVRGVISLCAGVMPCGSLGAAYFRKYGAREDRTFLVPYEPDYDLLASLPQATIDQTRQRFGLDASRKRVVFCARMIPIKKADLAARAFAQIADRRPEFDLVMVGDGPERERAAALVPEGLRDRVKFTGFIGSQETVSAIYRASHVFLHPCVYEPWGVVINESVAAGLAVAACAHVGAAAELVRDGVNGRLFPPDNLDAAAQALLDVTDPANLDRYRAASAGVLADWRRRGDPVEGIRQALRSAGVALGG
jgi:glycosyltransferase involved in cell wall biosynthesis